jgi:hypothetical protein
MAPTLTDLSGRAAMFGSLTRIFTVHHFKSLVGQR